MIETTNAPNFFSDADECLSDSDNNCSTNAHCQNVVDGGGYNCECFDGYEGNGFDCIGKYYVWVCQISIKNR